MALLFLLALTCFTLALVQVFKMAPTVCYIPKVWVHDPKNEIKTTIT